MDFSSAISGPTRNMPLTFGPFSHVRTRFISTPVVPFLIPAKNILSEEKKLDSHHANNKVLAPIHLYLNYVWI